MKKACLCFEFPKTNTLLYIGDYLECRRKVPHSHTTQAKSPVFKHIEAKDSNLFKKLTRRIKSRECHKKENILLKIY